MSKVDIEKLLELEAKCDPEPWMAEVVRDDNGFSKSMRLYGYDPYMPGKIEIMYYRNPENNLILIEAMRNSIKSLCEELRAAREVVEAAKNEKYSHLKHCMNNKCWHYESDLYQCLKELGGEK